MRFNGLGKYWDLKNQFTQKHYYICSTKIPCPIHDSVEVFGQSAQRISLKRVFLETAFHNRATDGARRLFRLII